MIEFAKRQAETEPADKPADARPADLLAVQRWVTLRYQTFLAGTAANIVIALTVAAIGRTIVQMLKPGFAV